MNAFALALLASFAIGADAAPAPEPTPIKVIVSTHSSAYCTALRQSVAPAVVGLRLNDGVIGASTIAFAKMGHDASNGASHTVDLDEVYAESLMGSLVNNLAVIDRVLNDPARFPVPPKTYEDKKLLAIKEKLAAIARQQRASLDVVSGVIGTQQLSRLQHMPDPMAGSLAPTVDPLHPLTPGNGDISHLYQAGVTDKMPGPGDTNYGALIANAGQYAPFVRSIVLSQAAELETERALTPLIVAGAQECGGKGSTAPH